MSQGKKEFLLGILLTLLLWLFGPDIIPSQIEPFARPIAGALLIIIIIWVIIGNKVIDWYNNTSKERKSQRIISLRREFIEVEAMQIYFTKNPDRFIPAVTKDILQILKYLCVGFLMGYLASAIDILPIPLSVIAVPSFFDAYKAARKTFWLYQSIYFFDLFKEHIDAEIRSLSSQNTSSELEIKKAFYIIKDTEIKLDVTDTLSNKIINNKIDYVVGNDLVIYDPAPNFKKELILTAAIKGKKEQRVISEGNRLILP